MARFEVYQMADGALAVDCQADLLSHLKMRLVVPLLPEADVTQPIRKLNPIVSIGDNDFYFCADLAAAVSTSQLRAQVVSLERDSDSLSAALDMLLIGF